MKPLRPHEVQALEFLSLGPDRITVIENDETFAAALSIEPHCTGRLACFGRLIIGERSSGKVCHLIAFAVPAVLANARGAS